MRRLNSEVLSALKQAGSGIGLPQYDRSNTKAGIVHLGIGAFHRAHQAFYTESILNIDGGDWGIVGASLRSPNVKEQLEEQDGLYTMVVKAPKENNYTIIGAVKEVLVGPENPRALVSRMAEASIKIVSLTVTEKGYCHDPATGDLNFNHPDIQYDLENLQSPKTAVGYIVSALSERKCKGVKSFSVLSCDNLPNNGEVLKNVVLQFANRISTDLGEWISENSSFPATMIDRIVPATTEEDIKDLAYDLEYHDEGAVITEPFTQWVIEDDFCNGRPAWEKVGAQLTNDVNAFEKIKLRLLNGSHSTLAYAGYLSGYETISDVMGDPAFTYMIRKFMDSEVSFTLDIPEGFDLSKYKESLLERFSNPSLKHRTWQIAMDGSQKLPQRLLETLDFQLNHGGEVSILCLAIAAWIKYVSGIDESGNEIDVQDPFAVQLRRLHEENRDNNLELISTILGVQEIFGQDLCTQFRVKNSIYYWLESFDKIGVLKTIHNHF